MHKPFIAALLCLPFLACTRKAPEAAPTPSPAANDMLLTPGKVLEKSESSDLPFKVYRFLSGDPKNVCLSPLSLEQAFGLLYLGANGKTRSSLEQLFGFKGDEVYSLKNEALDKPIEFAWGNSIWIKPGKTLSPSYLEAVKEKLGAETSKTLDLKQINGWVAKVTHDKIQNLIQHLELNTLSVLINAFYLKAPWAIPFEKERDLFGPFQSSTHQSSQVTYLNRTGSLPYFEDDKSTWVELDYQGYQLSMVLGLPKKKFDLRSVEDRLNAKYWDTVSKGLSPQKVDLKLPKFTMETSLSLKKVFQDLGYNDLFTTGDYSRMTLDRNLLISEILQATYLKVDETGTEAAAATALTLGEGASFSKPKPFWANEPFLFMIRNKKSGKLYFIGRVYEPK